jgi:hypothetical protein
LASSGNNSSTGSSKPKTPSSISESTAAAVIGLMVDVIRTRVSRRIGAPPIVLTPAATTSAMSPCATAATTPGAGPSPTARSTISLIPASGRSSNASVATTESAYDIQSVAPGRQAEEPSRRVSEMKCIASKQDSTRFG